MSTLREAWEALRSEARTDAGWHVRRIYPSAPCELLAGILQPGVTPGLLFELSTDEVPNGLILPRSRGFTVEPAVVRPGSFGRVRFSLALAEPAYKAVFAVLCEDAAATAAGESNTRDAIRSWIGRLHVWQEFMARHGAGDLSDEAAAGLFGELWFLRERIAPAIGYGPAVDAWSGPQGQPNDFALPGGFAEVKATLQQAPLSVSISNLAQLDEQRGSILLAHIQLRNDPNGESLGQLVSTLRVHLTGEGASRLRLFNDLLLKTGFIDAHSEITEQTRSVISVTFYRIGGDFPRVTRTEVRAGVLECRYTIDLARCAPFMTDRQALHRMLLPAEHA